MKQLVWIDPATQKVMPREATADMIACGDDFADGDTSPRMIYKAMLAAAPEVQGVELPPEDTRADSDCAHCWNAYREAIIRSKP